MAQHHYSPHTLLLIAPLRSANSSPPPYQEQIISAYCIVVNGHTIPGLIGCLSDFVFVLLCPCLSINPDWLQSSQPGEWIRQESDNWLPRRGRSFISVGLPGLIEWNRRETSRQVEDRRVRGWCWYKSVYVRVGGMRWHVSALLKESSVKGFQDKEYFTFVFYSFLFNLVINWENICWYDRFHILHLHLTPFLSEYINLHINFQKGIKGTVGFSKCNSNTSL